MWVNLPNPISVSSALHDLCVNFVSCSIWSFRCRLFCGCLCQPSGYIVWIQLKDSIETSNKKFSHSVFLSCSNCDSQVPGVFQKVLSPFCIPFSLVFPPLTFLSLYHCPLVVSVSLLPRGSDRSWWTCWRASWRGTLRTPSWRCWTCRWSTPWRSWGRPWRGQARTRTSWWRSCVPPPTLWALLLLLLLLSYYS